MAELIGTLIGGSAMLFIGAGLLVAIFLTYWLPLMAFRAMRDVRRIREQFERLNDILERQASHAFVGKPNGRGEMDHVPGSDAWTRTGPLNIR